MYKLVVTRNMANSHREAVKILARQQSAKSTVDTVYVHRVSGYPDPSPIGNQDHIPDIFIEYSNGREKIIEVDTKGNVEDDQIEAFNRSANAKPSVRSFEHYFTSDV